MMFGGDDGKRVRVGEVWVDSGQVLITDPCYLDRWVNDEYNGEAAKPNAKGEYPFSYVGAASATLSKARAGQLELGVASSSGWGDGSYPVYATFKGGRVAKLEIEFMQDEEEEEPEEEAEDVEDGDPA